jgi:uncharacterized membrane protein YqaE (UPF0057 family)
MAQGYANACAKLKYVLPDGKKGMDNKIVALIISIILPPLAVYLSKGAGKDLLINVLLCLLMWLPGVLHAIWLTVL